MHTITLLLLMLAIQTGHILAMPVVNDPAEVESDVPQDDDQQLAEIAPGFQPHSVTKRYIPSCKNFLLSNYVNAEGLKLKL